MAAAPQPDPRLRDVLDRRDELKAKKSTFDAQAQKVCELIIPSRDFTMTRRPGELRTRHLRDATGVLSNKRLSAFLYGDMLSPALPWVQPNLLGRDATSEEAEWFERSSVRMHARLSGPQSPIATQLYEAAQDATGLGNNCTFLLRKQAQLPRFLSVPLADVCWDEHEGIINVAYRDFRYTARMATREYPESVKIQEIAEKEPRRELLFVQAVEPRADGVKGAIGARKPWTSTIACVDTKEIVKDAEGFDRFPFQIGRFERASGDVYGTGPGWHALATVWSANAMAESILRAAELLTDPPLFGNAAAFGGRFDRRPGAVNPIKDNLALYGQSMRDVIGKIDIAGDVSTGVAMLDRQQAQIERFFYVDWLWLRENAMMTATEVNARRDNRMRMMAPVVARLEQEWLNPLVEEMFFAMLQGGHFDPPPRSLASQEIGFNYRSPLALAQRGAVFEAIDRTFDIAAKAHQFDETASLVLKTDELLREAADMRGISAKRLRDPRDLAAMRAQRDQERQQMAQMAMAKDAGAALQAGAQGAASLANIGQAPGELKAA